MTLDDRGNRLAPDVVWNDAYGAGGGGVSAVFERPDFQDGVRPVVDWHRGTPDISLSAAVDGAVVTDYSFLSGAERGGFQLVGGTSEATPEFAGIVAMAAQLAHRRLGTLGDSLYELRGSWGGIVDITKGNNTFGPFTNSDGNTYTVVGYNAMRGYDLASGLGTIDAARLFLRWLRRQRTDPSGRRGFPPLRRNARRGGGAPVIPGFAYTAVRREVVPVVQ